MTKTGRQSSRHHEMHTQEHALKKKTPIYDFFPVGESRLYWYTEVRRRSLKGKMTQRRNKSEKPRGAASFTVIAKNKETKEKEEMRKDTNFLVILSSIYRAKETKKFESESVFDTLVN